MNNVENIKNIVQLHLSVVILQHPALYYSVISIDVCKIVVLCVLNRWQASNVAVTSALKCVIA